MLLGLCCSGWADRGAAQIEAEFEIMSNSAQESILDLRERRREANVVGSTCRQLDCIRPHSSVSIRLVVQAECNIDE